jgi:NADH:ubiquinone oxidoreductase subunit 3 (subunit A)
MKENLSEELYEEENNEIIPQTNQTVVKKKIENLYISNFLKLFIIFDIISIFIMLIFMLTSLKVFFWIFFSTTIILTCLIIISYIIIYKEKQDLKKKREK